MRFHTLSLPFSLLFFTHFFIVFDLLVKQWRDYRGITVDRCVHAFLWIEGSAREASTLDVMTSIPQSFPLLARWINVTSTAIEPAYSKAGPVESIKSRAKRSIGASSFYSLIFALNYSSRHTYLLYTIAYINVK